MTYLWEQLYYDRLDAIYAGERLPSRLSLRIDPGDRTWLEECQDPAAFTKVLGNFQRIVESVLSSGTDAMTEAVWNLIDVVVSRRPYLTRS